MDGQPLYPQGHHPVRLHYAPDNVHHATPLARIDNPVRYFYIDFGISHRFAAGSKPMLLGRKGRNQQVPELSSTVPYDAFKVDVYGLGDVYAKEFVDVRVFHPLSHRLSARSCLLSCRSTMVSTNCSRLWMQ